jgi:hypothetical protein
MKPSRNIFPLMLLLTAAALAQTNPVPLINNPLVPDAAAPGGATFTLTVNGTGFVSSSVVNWNGNALATAFVSRSQLTATVPSANIATASTASVTVVNPAPGGPSNVVFFSIRKPFNAISFATTTLSGIDSPHSVTVADLNADGNLDFIVGEVVENAILVFLGNGDGTFQPPATYPVAGFPTYTIVASDFNHDGNVDLAVSNISSDGFTGYASVLLGNGDGTFQPHQDFSAGTVWFGMTAGDFNGDGNLDLVVANDSFPPTYEFSVLLGNGDGTFQAPVFYGSGYVGGGVTAGDFNGDGKLDLAIAGDAVSNTGVDVWLGNGDGTFQPPMGFSTAESPYSAITGDFNQDGKLDLAVRCVGNDVVGDISVLFGNGDGTFQNHVDYPTSAGEEIAEADLNGDGILDFATPGGTASAGEVVATFLGRGNGTFGVLDYFPIGNGEFAVAAGDFDNDGMLDLVAGNLYDNTISVLRQVTSVLSTTLVNFGQVKIGKTSGPMKVKFTNIGNAAFSISSIGVTGTYAADFQQHNNCPSSVAAGASCVIEVFFTPLQHAQMAADVTITDSAAQAPQTITLEGTGVRIR